MKESLHNYARQMFALLSLWVKIWLLYIEYSKIWLIIHLSIIKNNTFCCKRLKSEQKI